MMALPATCSRPRRWSQRRPLVLARLHPAMQAPAVPPAEGHICRQALPRSRGGLRQMLARGSECDWLPLASASPRRSKMEYHFSLVRTLFRFCSLKG